MATRSKRWNGNVDSLPADYLKLVMQKMADYGGNVQFSLVSSGPEPSYQITNDFGKAMAFDRNHHLLRPEEHEFAGANATRAFTTEQLKTAAAGIRPAGASRGAKTARVVRTGGTGTRVSAARLDEQFAAQRYEYYRNNRQLLPAAITEHTAEITDLMRQGKSAEEAFGEVLKKYF